ncbi:hypothetical protein ESA94_07375 [Lacibacter luteus]|uniref:Uncharacterized protein n=1 Tax=Lacibacter luteus TaxID=2508719 RepID=A0A4Q1CQ66_9BACT|nr:hypothetical protein [Lacibacter luteus]RXK62809.1 hypothetical protein ESA94_07375 [Lacibacter luteus]
MAIVCLVFKSISTTSLLRKGVLIGFIIYVFTLSIYFFFFADGNYYDKTPSSFQGVLVIVLSILFFYEQIKKPDTLFIYALPEFWYVTAVFIHAAGTFFIYIFAAFWLQNSANENDYMNIFGSLSILHNLLIAFATFKQYKDPLLSTTSKPITA